jgi:hypothetical protein
VHDRSEPKINMIYSWFQTFAIFRMKVLKEPLTPTMKTEWTECYETSAHKIQAPRYLPTERIHQFDLVSVWRGICYILCSYPPCSILYLVKFVCVFWCLFFGITGIWISQEGIPLCLFCSDMQTLTEICHALYKKEDGPVDIFHVRYMNL